MVPNILSFKILSQTIAQLKQDEISDVSSNLWASANTISHIVNNIDTIGNPAYLSRTLNPIQFGYDITGTTFADPYVANWWYERPGPKPSREVNDYVNPKDLKDFWEDVKACDIARPFMDAR